MWVMGDNWIALSQFDSERNVELHYTTTHKCVKMSLRGHKCVKMSLRGHSNNT
jgi:hypothetical protein